MSISIQNRNEIYLSIYDSLPKRRALIYKKINQYEPCSALDIEKITGMKVNKFSGRITELKNSFLIKEVGLKHYKKNCSSTQYSIIRNANERVDLINAEFVRLRDKRDSLLSDYHMGLSAFTKYLLKKELKKIDDKIKGLENILDALKVDEA